MQMIFGEYEIVTGHYADTGRRYFQVYAIGAPEEISDHATYKEAREAINRYRQGDARRRTTIR